MYTAHFAPLRVCLFFSYVDRDFKQLKEQQRQSNYKTGSYLKLINTLFTGFSTT